METRAAVTAGHDTRTTVDPVALRATRVFRAGFFGSLALLVIGLCSIAVRSESLPAHLVPLDDVIAALREGSSASFITLGILTMILTPVVSTFTIFLTFFLEGDHRYARLAAVVLVILILSISLSLLS